MPRKSTPETSPERREALDADLKAMYRALESRRVPDRIRSVADQIAEASGPDVAETPARRRGRR